MRRHLQRSIPPLILALFTLTLAACGSSSASGAVAVRPDMEQPLQEQPLQPESVNVRLAGIDVSYKRLPDSANRETVIRYLHDALSDGPGFVRRWAGAPTVAMVSGTTPKQRNEVYRAIEIVTEALPTYYRLQRYHYLIPPDEWPQGAIVVQFLPPSEYDKQFPGTAGQAEWQSLSGRLQAARVWIKDGSPNVVQTIVHELLHAMGLEGHVESFPSVLNIDTNHPMQSIDRDGLRAFYGLDIGDSPDDLGLWTVTNQDLEGSFDLPSGGTVKFGVQGRSGLAMSWIGSPWLGVASYEPGPPLADNPGLTGTVAWEGILLGFTPDEAPVVGDAHLTVSLDTLSGQAAFTDLESWTAGAAPGNPGTGSTWGDGDLGYDIAVTDNTFMQTGGDAGILLGAFFGDSHEGVAGELHRDDLAAAFGGARQ